MDSTFKPYLLRALYDWCVDQGHDPYLVVLVDEYCKVPSAYIKDGRIVLDISPSATKDLELGLEDITFQARFGGVAQHLYIPINRVIGLFPENFQEKGTFFEATATDNNENNNKNDKNDKNIENSTKPLAKSRFSRVK